MIWIFIWENISKIRVMIIITNYIREFCARCYREHHVGCIDDAIIHHIHFSGRQFDCKYYAVYFANAKINWNIPGFWRKKKTTTSINIIHYWYIFRQFSVFRCVCACAYFFYFGIRHTDRNVFDGIKLLSFYHLSGGKKSISFYSWLLSLNEFIEILINAILESHFTSYTFISCVSSL